MDRLVVVGDGDTGAAVAHRLARVVGSRVLVLDAGPGAPDPAGPATVVRTDLAHPDDARTALAPAAYEAWRDLERVSGQPLLVETGGVLVADRDRPEVGRLAAVADRHGVDVTLLDALALTRRWPRVRPGPDDHALATPRSGLLDATRAAAVHRALAAGHGAEVRRDAAVRALRPASGHVEVVLDGEVVRADHVVVAAGAGTAAVLGDALDLPLAEHPQQTARHATPCLLDFAPAHFPVLSWCGPRSGDRAARFDAVGTHGDAATRLTGWDSGASADARWSFLAAHLPDFAGPTPEHAEPLRTVTALPDGTMALGTLPGEPRVGVAVGTGRHPMFVGVVGRALADLALRGRTRAPVAPFALTAQVGGATGATGAAGRSR